MAADIGNYDGSVHQPGYVSEFRFLAAGAQTEDMEQRVEETHARWISTPYLHNIYTISAQYLHTISTHAGSRASPPPWPRTDTWRR